MACAAGERDGPLRAGPKERVLGRRREMERGEGSGLGLVWAGIWGLGYGFSGLALGFGLPFYF